MGMEIPVTEDEEDEQVATGEDVRMTDDLSDVSALKSRPAILWVGPPAVGKRSLLNRLITRRKTAQAVSETGAICQGWTIDTKYYIANVCTWVAQLDNPALEATETIEAEFGRCEALVMVFDLSNAKSFQELQEWVTGVELGGFEILLCVGNKADRAPEHFGHAEYRRKLQKRGESSSDPHPEFWDFGIDRTEGSTLLDEEVESADDRRRSCIEWCSVRGIEYIEACAINEVFDECISVDGDLQGIPRIFGALSAHMWPGLIMKDRSGSNEATQSQLEQEDMTSDDDSDYYIEYELLSNGSAEPWEPMGWEEQWSVEGSTPRASGSVPYSTAGPVSHEPSNEEFDQISVTETSEKSTVDGPQSPGMGTSSSAAISGETANLEHVDYHVVDQNGDEVQEGQLSNTSGQRGQKSQGVDDMDKLMSEMTSMRLNMRSMSDQQRREMAAQLAMRMASMFGEDEEGSDLD